MNHGINYLLMLSGLSFLPDSEKYFLVWHSVPSRDPGKSVKPFGSNAWEL